MPLAPTPKGPNPTPNRKNTPSRFGRRSSTAESLPQLDVGLPRSIAVLLASTSELFPSFHVSSNISFSVNFEFSLFSSRTVLRIGNPFSFSSLFVTFRRGEARVCCGTAVFQARVHCSARSFRGLASRALQFFAFSSWLFATGFRRATECKIAPSWR